MGAMFNIYSRGTNVFILMINVCIHLIREAFTLQGSVSVCPFLNFLTNEYFLLGLFHFLYLP